MKQYIKTASLAALFLVNACVDNPRQQDHITVKDTAAHVGYVNKGDAPYPISENLILIIKYLDSLRYFPDTDKLTGDAYYAWHLKNAPRLNVMDRTFYRLDTINDLFFLIRKNSNKEFTDDSWAYLQRHNFDWKPFYKVNSITGYYFYSEGINGGDYINGFIEEWKFRNEDNARNAIRELLNNKCLELIYFNSFCYAFYRSSYLYVMYSRADWEEKALVKLARGLQKKCNAFDLPYGGWN